MNLVRLSREQHADLRIDPTRAAGLASTVHLVPIVRSELRKVAAHYPIFFAKDGDTGRFFLAALMGLEPHENLYWNGAELDAAYVPLNLLRLPFYVGGDAAESGAICVDMESPALSEDGTCAILAADGTDSSYMAGIHATLNELAAQQGPTRIFIDQAVERGLVHEVKLDIRFDDGSEVVLNGLYGVDERLLVQEVGRIDDPDMVFGLFAITVSIEHVAGLVRRRNIRITQEKRWFERPDVAGVQ